MKFVYLLVTIISSVSSTEDTHRSPYYGRDNSYPPSTYYSPNRARNFKNDANLDNLFLPENSPLVDPYSVCGVNKTCFGAEENCLTSRSCSFLLLGSYLDDEQLEFEIIANHQNNGQYYAMGLSFDLSMGDDAVIECIVKPNNIAYLRESFNEGKSNIVSQSIDYIRNLQVKFHDGKVSCKWRQPKVITTHGLTFDISKVHTLLAKGDLESGDEKAYHSFKTWSVPILDYSKSTLVSSVSTVNRLIKVHGSLMVLTWLTFVSVAMLLARHYKPIWPETLIFGKQLWFVLHQGTMIVAIILAIVSQICIFIYVGGFRVTSMHQCFGATAFLLMLTQPIGALFRCAPGHDKRWIFNWFHWFIGNSAHILAIATIFLAYNFNQLSLPAVYLWILIVFVICHCFVHLILQIHYWCTQGSHKVSDSIQMTDMKAGDSIVTETTNSFKQIMLGFYVVIVTLISVIIVLIICLSSSSS